MMETITSRKNPAVAALRRLGTDRAYRRESGLFLCQGRKLLEEALAARAEVETLLYCGDAAPAAPNARVFRALPALLEYASPMPSAPDVLFSVRQPAEAPLSGARRLLLAENMQDPGNVGALARSAAAFGFDGLLLAGACADPWGAKAVRASMGAVFRLRIWERETEAALAALKALELPVYAAALADGARALGGLSFPARLALAVGNEGHGLSHPILDAAAEIVRIPMAPGAESLNAAAAAAVLLWEAYRGGEAGCPT